jgi:hypothetical protein
MTEVQALQAALAAEYETVYGYGVVGAQLTTAIEALHATPVAAHAAYQLPFAVDSAQGARELAAHLEQGVCGAAWDVIAASAPGALRGQAVDWLADAAARAAHWGTQQALPGQPA